MKIRQIIGTVFIACVLFSMILGILGIWGIIQGDVTGRLIGTAIVTSIGLGAAGTLLDKFWGEGTILTEAVDVFKSKPKTEEKTPEVK
jgi:hypothetical protein